MYSIGIIVNPNAKRIRRSARNLSALLGDIGGKHVRVFETPSIDDIPPVLWHLKKENIPIIGICGGDGTIHQVISGIINIWGKGRLPMILVLPCGTMNNVARTLSMKGKGPAVLRRVIQLLELGKELPTSVRFTMNIEDRYCFLFGCGFTSNFLDAVYGGTEKGFIQNCRVIGSAIKDIITKRDGGPLFRPLHATVAIDGRLLNYKQVTGILSGTVEHIGMGFSPMPRGTEPGTFQSIVTAMGSRSILININRLRKGDRIRHRHHTDVCCCHLSIQADEPFRFTMDGDMYSSPGKVDVLLGPAIKLVKA